MTRFVFGTDIGFGLDDPADGCTIRMLSHQVLAKQLPGNIKGRFLVERTIDFHGLCECVFEPLRKLFAELVGLAWIVLRSFPLQDVEGQFLKRR
jgi:hypothetical protein